MILDSVPFQQQARVLVWMLGSSKLYELLLSDTFLAPSLQCKVRVLTGLGGIKRLVQLLLVQVICGTAYPGLGILPDAIEAGWYKGAPHIGAASYLWCK